MSETIVDRTDLIDQMGGILTGLQISYTDEHPLSVYKTFATTIGNTLTLSEKYSDGLLTDEMLLEIDTLTITLANPNVIANAYAFASTRRGFYNFYNGVKGVKRRMENLGVPLPNN